MSWKILYPLLCGLVLASSLSLVSAKPSPGRSTSDPFTVQGASRASDAKADCVAQMGRGSATARNTATTSSNRPVANLYYPRYLAAKAVLVFTTFAGGRQLVAQSDYKESYSGNMGALTADTTYTYNCADFANLYSGILGYGFHKALPANDDPTPNGGRTVVYSDNNGGQYSWQPW
jgi:hypothetical protein